MKQRVILRNKKTFVATYDQEGILDTVTVKGSDELLSANNKDVKFILAHANDILARKSVRSIEYAE